jgi:uncharacterized protein (TIGR02453 family)
MTWHVYVARCGDGTLYTGITTDPVRRAAAHNAGRGASYTRARRPVRLVHLETAADRPAALRRELAIKRLPRRLKEQLVNGTTLSAEFRGFGPGALKFLRGLARHNDREWFERHRPVYEAEVRDPLRALVEEMDVRLARVAPELVGDPRRSIFRIHRDVRFSKDKSPYKTNLGADFPYVDEGAGGGEGDGPHSGGGGYVHISPAESFVGGGMWHPEPVRLAAFRALVDKDPGRVTRAVEEPGFVARFGSVNGDKLKRVPTGFPPDHPHAELLKLKDVTFGRSLALDEVFSAKLPDIIVDDFAAAMPVYRLLATLPAS